MYAMNIILKYTNEIQIDNHNPSLGFATVGQMFFIFV